MTKAELLADNHRLRERIHEIQCRADSKVRRIMELEMKLRCIDAVTQIGETFFWDISACAERPLHLSISEATTIGAKLMLNLTRSDK